MILLALDVRESRARSLGGTLTLFTLFVSAFFSSMTLGQTNSSMPPDSLTPPKVRVDPVEEKFHGHTVSDPYRWLEDAESADTQEFVRAESAYTRSILDPLPGRGKIESRLKEVKCAGPKVISFSGAEEAHLLFVRHRMDTAGNMLHAQTYARVGRWVGIVTLTALEAQLNLVRPDYDAFVKGLRIGPAQAG